MQQPYSTGPYAGQPQYMQGPPPPPAAMYPPQQYGQPYPPAYPGQPMGPPPPYGVPMGQPVGMPMQPSVVIVEQPMIITGFGNAPTSCVCPNCKASITTTVEATPGGAAWLSCLCLFIVGAWPCMFIPFCVDSCMDVSHVCPNCRIVIRKRSAFDEM